MIRKAWPVVVVVAVAGMAMLLSIALVAAQDIGRSLPEGPFEQGDELIVTMNGVGLADGFGTVVETLPAGFSYVADSANSTTPNAAIDGEASGQAVIFTLVAVDSFTYMVTVGPNVEDGSHVFSGVLQKLSGDEDISGDDAVIVRAEATTTLPDAATGDISRSLPGSSVGRDDEFSVTINEVGLADGFGTVVETLPAGFSYVTGSASSATANAAIDGEASGQAVTFTLVAVDSFTYMVTVGPNVEDGRYSFSGVLQKLSGDEGIGGDTSVTVEGGSATAPAGVNRSLPSSVASGREFSVTINNVGLADGFGTVVETLPAGFSYVAGSAISTTPNAAIDGEASGQEVTFTLVAVDSFMYMVTVGSNVEDGSHVFSGVLQKLSGDETIGGDTSVSVEGGATTTPGGVRRSLPSSVASGREFSVTINNVGLADGFGTVVETLPAGFSYVADSASSTTPNAAIDGEVSGQAVTFTLVAVESFTYRVTVGSNVADGRHVFSGVLQKLSGDEAIGGDTRMTVGVPRPRPTSSSSGSGGGSGGGGATGVESTPAPAVPADNPPIIAGGTREEFNVPENMTAVTSLSVVDGRRVTWNISGGFDAAEFTIGAESGALTFKTAPDFENPDR